LQGQIEGPLKNSVFESIGKVKDSAKTVGAADVLETLYILSENKMYNFCCVI
jgi:hypothetical protein